MYLTDDVSYLNCWQAAFPDPQLRLEHEGFPIPVRTAGRGGGGCTTLCGEVGCFRPSAKRRRLVATSGPFAPVLSLSFPPHPPLVGVSSLEGSLALRQHPTPMFLTLPALQSHLQSQVNPPENGLRTLTCGLRALTLCPPF